MLKGLSVDEIETSVESTKDEKAIHRTSMHLWISASSSTDEGTLIGCSGRLEHSMEMQNELSSPEYSPLFHKRSLPDELAFIPEIHYPERQKLNPLVGRKRSKSDVTPEMRKNIVLNELKDQFTRPHSELTLKEAKTSKYKRRKAPPSSPKSTRSASLRAVFRARSRSTLSDDGKISSSRLRVESRKSSLFRKENKSTPHNSVPYLSLPSEVERKLSWSSMKEAINVISVLKSPLLRRKLYFDQYGKNNIDEDKELIEQELQELKLVNPEAYSKVVVSSKN